MTTVLVVDDEAPIRLLCRVNLEAEGMTVLEAADGDKGLELARAEHPDVVLLDVMMPGRSGWEVAEELLGDESTSSIPIIFLTARAEIRDRAKGIDLGGVNVTKPFNPVELAPLVQDLLRRVESGERDDLRREVRRVRELLRARISFNPRKSAVTRVARAKRPKAPLGVATPIRQARSRRTVR
jgi:DNA-binding response OmpR family regulator